MTERRSRKSKVILSSFKEYLNPQNRMINSHTNLTLYYSLKRLIRLFKSSNNTNFLLQQLKQGGFYYD